MIPERWRRELIVPELGECHLWEGATSAGGYPLMKLDGKVVGVHRQAYIEEFGEIPEGLVIDHLCRARACVRAAHLEAVTNAENIRRGKSAKLTPALVEQIRAASGTDRELGRRFGITPAYVWKLRSGAAWQGVAA